MEVNIADKIAPCYDDWFFDVMEHGHTHYWLPGGRGSAKSTTISEAIPLLLMQPKNKDLHAVILRKVGQTLRDSVYNQILWAIEELGVMHLWRVKTSPLELTYKPTGQKIMFRGVDDKLKIKSIKPAFGYVGVVWYEELDQFDSMEEIRNLNQSLLRGGDIFWCFCSYNPPKSRDNWVNEEVLFNDSDRLVLHTNYTQIPKEWLGPQFIAEAEKLKRKREELWRHEYMGEVIGSGGDVFDNVQDRRMSDNEIQLFDRLHYGCDFGFAVDPLAFVAMHYDKKHEDLYIFDEIYKYSYDTRPAAEEIKSKAGRGLVIGDSAEPRTIKSFKNYGVNMIGAKKGPDSVAYGIKWLQERRNIYIDKERCPNTYKEFVKYEYARNKDGSFISCYPDANNHAIDAVRYGCSGIMRNEKDVTSRNVNLW